MIDRFKDAQLETDQPIEFQDDRVKFIITNRETKWKINCLNSPVVGIYCIDLDSSDH